MKYYPVATNIIKEELYSFLRLEINLEEPENLPRGFCNFPENYDSDYFKMLTAEEKKKVIRRGVPVYGWEKIRERNEALDCRVYARAAAFVLGLDRWVSEDFDIIESNLINQINVNLTNTQNIRKKSDFW